MVAKKTVLGMMLLVTANACQKEPLADFTSDRQFHYAGETIHLKNTSVDAYSWKWTTPDGKFYDTKDLAWVSDFNDTGTRKEITLEAFSKRGNKTSSITKSLVLRQPIFSTDFFSVNNSSYLPTEKKTFKTPDSMRVIRVNTLQTSTYMTAHFFGSGIPSAGTYSVVPNYPYVGQVLIQINESWGYHTSYTGQATVTHPNPGWVRIQFNNVSDTYGSGKLSGDITVH